MNRNWTKFLSLLIVIISCLGFGCVSTKYIPQQQYVLSLRLQANNISQNNKAAKHTLLLAPVVAVAPFDQMDFLYRLSTDKYIVDYYHGFLVAPSEQIVTLAKLYFRQRGDIALETFITDTAKPKLQITLKELYADYRERAVPRGVIVLRFLVTQEFAAKSVVLFDKTYRAQQKLVAKDNQNLLQAWNLGLETILAQALRNIQQTIHFK